jgi:hypothetical protein
MDNPFAIGDLVHISQGVILYDLSGYSLMTTTNDFFAPKKVNDKPTVGLITNNPEREFYNVSIGNEQYYVRKEDIALVSRKVMR